MSMHVHYERKFILVLHQESWKVFFELVSAYNTTIFGRSVTIFVSSPTWNIY